MAAENELRNAVRETLRKEGYLNKLQAEVRVHVMGMLDQDKIRSGSAEKPKMPQEILILNELIREYLEWMAYTYSGSVFSAESGMPSDKMSRDRLSRHLGLAENGSSKSLPLLLNLVTSLEKEPDNFSH